MLFSVYALFFFFLTAFVAAVPAGSRRGRSGATPVATIPLENEAAYLTSGRSWTRRGGRLVSGRLSPQWCTCI